MSSGVQEFRSSGVRSSGIQRSQECEIATIDKAGPQIHSVTPELLQLLNPAF
jgi:hypothetical protein